MGALIHPEGLALGCAMTGEDEVTTFWPLLSATAPGRSQSGASVQLENVNALSRSVKEKHNRCARFLSREP